MIERLRRYHRGEATYGVDGWTGCVRTKPKFIIKAGSVAVLSLVRERGAALLSFLLREERRGTGRDKGPKVSVTKSSYRHYPGSCERPDILQVSSKWMRED